jgi:hypothetical protein
MDAYKRAAAAAALTGIKKPESRTKSFVPGSKRGSENEPDTNKKQVLATTDTSSIVPINTSAFETPEQTAKRLGPRGQVDLFDFVHVDEQSARPPPSGIFTAEKGDLDFNEKKQALAIFNSTGEYESKQEKIKLTIDKASGFGRADPIDIDKDCRIEFNINEKELYIEIFICPDEGKDFFERMINALKELGLNYKFIRLTASSLDPEKQREGTPYSALDALYVSWGLERSNINDEHEYLGSIQVVLNYFESIKKGLKAGSKKTKRNDKGKRNEDKGKQNEDNLGNRMNYIFVTIYRNKYIYNYADFISQSNG